MIHMVDKVDKNISLKNFYWKVLKKQINSINWKSNLYLNLKFSTSIFKLILYLEFETFKIGLNLIKKRDLMNYRIWFNLVVKCFVNMIKILKIEFHKNEAPYGLVKQE